MWKLLRLPFCFGQVLRLKDVQNRPEWGCRTDKNPLEPLSVTVTITVTITVIVTVTVTLPLCCLQVLWQTKSAKPPRPRIPHGQESTRAVTVTVTITVNVTVTNSVVDRCCGKQEVLNRPDRGCRTDKNPREPLPLPVTITVTVIVTVTVTFTVVDRCCGKQEVLNRPDRGCRTDKNPREPLARVLAKTYPWVHTYQLA